MGFHDKLANKLSEKKIAVSLKDIDYFKSVDNWVSTGVGELHYNLETYGFPPGIIEIAGKSRSGKTTLSLACIKSFLSKNSDNGAVLIVSSEKRDNKYYAEKMGIDSSKIMVAQITYLEEMVRAIMAFFEETDALSKEMGIKIAHLVVWDSIGSTMSKEQEENIIHNIKGVSKILESADKTFRDFELKHERMGSFAKNAKMFMKLLIGLFYDKSATFIMINHIYDNIGSVGSSSFGGEWVKFMPNIRLKTTLKETIKVKDEEVAQVSEIKVVKNDFGSRRPTNIRILLGVGIVLSEADIQLGLEEGFLVKEGVRKITFHATETKKISWNSPGELFAHYEAKSPLINLLQKKIEKVWNARVKELRENVTKEK